MTTTDMTTREVTSARGRLSVVIANYNHERYVPKAVESALEQTYPDVEVIVVDDGSKDGSVANLLPYRNRIQVIEQPNGGQGAAMNRGFAASTGAVVLFLDADDLLMPTAAHRIMQAMADGVVKVQFQLRLMDGRGQASEVMVPAFLPDPARALDEVLRTGYYVSPPSSGNAYARSFLSAVMPMPPEEWRFRADSYPIFLAPFHGAVRNTPEPCGYYRVHAGNQSGFGSISRKALEANLETMRVATTFIERVAGEYGKGVPSRLVERNFQYQKARVALLVLYGAGQNSVLRAGAGILSALRSVLTPNGQSVKGRVVFVLWLMALTIPSQRMRGLLVDLAFNPSRRRNTSTMQALLSLFRQPVAVADSEAC